MMRALMGCGWMFAAKVQPRPGAMIAWWCAISTILIVPGALADLTPQQQRDVVTEAQQSYDRGIATLRSNPGEAHIKFQNAAQRFQLVVDSGVRNGLLYYNLANAYLQSGDVGRAILNYRRAQRLIPGDARVASNLTFARSQCKTPIAPSGQRALSAALLWWHNHTAVRTRFDIFMIAYGLFWLAVLLRMWRGTGIWLIVAIGTGLVWIALGASVALDVSGWGHRPAGVILADNVIVRKGNGAGFEPQFAQALSPGVEFEVLEHRGDWLDIELPNGSSGWIEMSQAELVP